MKKIFISMPMAGKSREEIEQVQHDVLVAVGDKLNEEVELVENYLGEDYKRNPVKCLGESIKRLAEADYAVFVDGWEDVRSCEVERFCAESYEIEMLEATKKREGNSNGE